MLMSEGLFRFEGLCLGGLEWFLRDNAQLEAGGTRRLNWIRRLLSRWDQRDKQKGSCSQHIHRKGGLQSQPHSRRAWVAWGERQLYPHLVQDKASPELVGLCPFPREKRKEEAGRVRSMNFCYSSKFQGLCIIFSFVGPTFLGWWAESCLMVNTSLTPSFWGALKEMGSIKVNCLFWILPVFDGLPLKAPTRWGMECKPGI